VHHDEIRAMTYILGINAFHGDSSAALVRDGELIAACEEERYNRVKHWAGFPAESVRRCLQLGGIEAGDLDHVAVSFDPRAQFLRKLWFALRHPGVLRNALGRLRRQRRTLSLDSQLVQALHCFSGGLRAQIHRVEHHQAHLASAFLLSGWEDAALLSVDGMGDFTSTVIAAGKGTEVREFGRVYHPHSLGLMYNAVTLFLGFSAYGDEYKVMGLAPYGEPEFRDVFNRIVAPRGGGFELDLSYFTHGRSGIEMTWDGGVPSVAPFHSGRMEAELGAARGPGESLNRRHENVAASLQDATERVLFHLLHRLHALHPCERVCLAGGVAMNSVANGKVTRATPFREVYVPVGAADNGTAIGAAFHVWNRTLGGARKFVLHHAFWGDEPSDEEMEAAVEAHSVKGERLDEDALVARTVAALLEGKVVGWFQGRMEFGARALGNRSLLADPRRTDMQEIINLKIKFREKFRPFAPSVLEERVGEWFEEAQSSPVMEKVLVVRPEKRVRIPAVVHVDGTGRLQTVSRETHPLYHKLISAFEACTGVPMLLNTSLNENEPIVQSPAQAIRCMLRTRMDALVLGGRWVTRAPDGEVPGE
jgi:carbamoyltransferase